MPTHTLEIPDWHPARLNQFIGRAWPVVARLKKIDRTIVTAEARNAGVPLATTRRHVGLTIVLGPRGRASDPDAYWKSLLDALVCAGLLVDDSAKFVAYDCPTFERGPARLTRVLLTDLDDLPLPPRTKTRRAA